MPKLRKTKSLNKSLVRKGRPTPKGTFLHHAYLREDGSVDGEKLLSIVNRTPGAFDLMMLNAMIERGTIAAKYHEEASEIIQQFVTVVMVAGYGDEQSQTQIEAIKKLVHPSKYELPQSKIKEIVDKYETSPPLARAWELRSIMANLANVVEPRRSDKPYTLGEPVMMRETPSAPYFQGLWDLAYQYCRPNTTLQSLAIRIYLKHLEMEGITGAEATITERSLKRDLERARDWEQLTSEHEKVRRGRWHGGMIGDLPITWYAFSEGWKVRAKKKGARREAEGAGQKRLA